MRFYIEGNIGSGKTSLCNLLKDAGYTVYLEPVDEWMSSGMLQRFYNGDISPFDFQMFVIQSMMRREQNVDESLVIFERSVYSSLLFSEVLFKEGKISSDQYRIIKNIVENYYQTREKGIFIHVQTDPKICLQRIYQRCRDSESNIPLNYLKMLDFVHKEKFKGTHTINGNYSLPTVMSNVLDIIKHITQNLQSPSQHF